jgi:Carboxypeptidase regulatory-like domain
MLARNVVVAGTSAAVIAVLVFVVFANPSSKLTAEVGPVVPRPGNQAVVEGRVLEANGSGLEGAEVAVMRTGGKREIASSGEDGTFSVALTGGCSTYTVSVRAEANGDDVETASRARLCPGDSLPVDARVETYGHFIWVPGPR